MDYKFSNGIILPINFNPWVRCYRIHAYVFNLIGQKYPKFSDYAISNYLCLHNGKENIRQEYLDFHLDNNYINIRSLFRNNSWFDIVQIDESDNTNYIAKDELKHNIISFLQKGYYVMQIVNEEFLRHSARYGCHFSDNIALIYGYCAKTDAFLMLDYNAEGRFGQSYVPSEDYFKALYSVTVTNRINFIKAKDNLDFQFEKAKAQKLLRCYIESESAYTDHADYVNNIVGYMGVERTLKDSLSTGINLIRIRAIQEHKDMVARYMKYVYENEYIDTKFYYDEYLIIAKKMHTIFMKLLKKDLLKVYDTTCEIDAIRRLNEDEVKLLERYLS